MQEYTPSRGVRPFGCCVFQNLERRYKDGLSIDDGLSIIISTLREGYDGEVNENNIEIAVLDNKGFRLFTPEQVKNYLKD